MNLTRPWSERFAEWKRIVDRNDKRAKRIDGARHDRGRALAASVGIPPDCGCCLHNASIDDDMSGWCKGNPERLAAAKRAVRLLGEWRAHRAARRMNQAAYDRLCRN